MILSPQIEGAKIAWSGAKLWVKSLFWLALLALIAYGCWRAYSAVYDRGVADENARWVAAQARADQQQHELENAATAASERAADKAAADSQAATQAAATDTKKREDAIRDVYLSDPKAAAPCRPDGGPAPIPAGVFDQLNQAKRAAEAAAR